MLALVVDDSRAMRSILTRLMGDLGFDVAQAGVGAQAMEVLDAGARPDVILVDWNMPGEHGVRVSASVPGQVIQLTVRPALPQELASVVSWPASYDEVRETQS